MKLHRASQGREIRRQQLVLEIEMDLCQDAAVGGTNPPQSLLHVIQLCQ